MSSLSALVPGMRTRFFLGRGLLTTDALRFSAMFCSRCAARAAGWLALPCRPVILRWYRGDGEVSKLSNGAGCNVAPKGNLDGYW